MRNLMRDQKGYSQITTSVVILVCGIVIAGIYFSYVQLENYQVQQKEKEKAAQALIAGQQRALEETQQQIRELSEETQKSSFAAEEAGRVAQETQRKLQQGVDTNEAKDFSIQASELEPYLTGVIHLFCGENEGSGSLWNFDSLGYSVLTNQHVAKNNKGWNCVIGNTGKGAYKTENIIYSFNTYTDSAILKVNLAPISDGSWPISDLNYKISSLKKCSVEMPLGAPVVIIGYPAYAENLINIPGEQKQARQSYRTVSNGIISAHDSSVQVPYGKLPYINYFISAKIDGGNSGGVAISKDENGLCFLGIPTWLSIGNYETQGIVQNIHNVLYVE